MGEQNLALWGWHPATNTWIKLQVAATGALVIDPTNLFEDPPTDGETEKAPNSNWAHDHNDDPNAHHARLHALSDVLDHSGSITDAQHGVRTTANAHGHAQLSGVTANQHHARSHDHSNALDGSPIAVAGVPDLPATKITSLRFPMNRMPDGTLNWVLTAQGAGNNPAYAALPAGYTQGARVYNNAAQNINSGAFTILALNSERWDTDTIHDNVLNNSRLTCKTAGVYVISACVEFGTNTVGRRIIYILLNGATIICAATQNALSAGAHSLSVTTIYQLAVTNYVEMQVYQDSGGVLVITYVANYTPEFMMQRIG